MKNSFESASERPMGPDPEMHSSLGRAGGHGSMREKRGSVAEVYGRLAMIINLLPHDSKRRLGNQVEMIRKDPERTIEIIRNEIEAQRAILDLLDNPVSTDEALAMLDELLPPESVQ